MAWKELHFHTVDAELAQKMTTLRAGYLSLGEFIDELLPDSRSKSLCKTALEESLMRGIQSLAMLGEQQPAGQ